MDDIGWNTAHLQLHCDPPTHTPKRLANTVPENGRKDELQAPAILNFIVPKINPCSNPLPSTYTCLHYLQLIKLYFIKAPAATAITSASILKTDMSGSIELLVLLLLYLRLLNRGFCFFFFFFPFPQGPHPSQEWKLPPQATHVSRAGR